VTLSTLVCALCGTGLAMTQGVDDDGVTWTRQRCRCGRTDFLHLDKGKLGLDELRREHGEPSSDYEIFASPR
jgi:hypothetical protein